MLKNVSYSQCAYCDTNILSHLARHHELWSPLDRFLQENDFTVGISAAQIIELSEAQRLHDEIIGLLIHIPSAMVKTQDMILDEEVTAHPDFRSKSLLMHPLNSILTDSRWRGRFLESLDSEATRKARLGQLENAQKMATRLNQVKGNFHTDKTGRYTLERARDFDWEMVFQLLGTERRAFLEKYRYDVAGLVTDVFLSLRLPALVVYYKYYLGQRVPSRQSDYGDLSHLVYPPYCPFVVMERDLCQVLNQIKKHSNILNNTIVKLLVFSKIGHWNQIHLS